MARLLDPRALPFLLGLAGLTAAVAGAMQRSVPTPTIAVEPVRAESLLNEPERPTAERELAPVSLGATTVASTTDTVPSFLIATVRPGQLVALRARPHGRVLARLDSVTEFGSRQTFGVVRERGRWLAVVSSALLNGRLGWVRADSSIDVSTTRVSLILDLSRRRLIVRRGDNVIRRMTVGVGRPSSPTPQGRFAVTDKLSGYRYGPYYGCCIVALSAHQPNLPAGWRGGDRIAVHGTNNPGSIGTASSAGCPHASTSDMRFLMRVAPLGAPIFIRA